MAATSFGRWMVARGSSHARGNAVVIVIPWHVYHATLVMIGKGRKDLRVRYGWYVHVRICGKMRSGRVMSRAEAQDGLAGCR